MSLLGDANDSQPELGSFKVEVIQGKQPEPEAKSFAERELQRRKRLLRFYLALLAIPVAIGVVVLIFGRSDSKLVMDEIKSQAPPIVRREVGEQIKPTIKSEVQSQVNPTLEQLDALKARQETIEKETGSLKDSQATITKLQDESKSIRQDLDKLSSGINERLTAIEQLNLGNRVQSLERRPRPQRPPNKIDALTPRILTSNQATEMTPQQQKTPQ
jgi:small-conductance mechanosensitive channel